MVSEVKEELGIDVSFEELVSIGIIDYSVTTGELIDKELANVYVNNYTLSFDEFTIQTEEVSGVVEQNSTNSHSFGWGFRRGSSRRF